MYYKTMKTLVKTKVIRITSVQHDTLKKMKSYNIDTGKFIREAISEKIKTCNKFYERLSFPAEVKSDMGYICFKKELDYLNEVKKEVENITA